MEFKACLLFLVSLALVLTTINACTEAGGYCVSGDSCCSGSCLTFRARCSAPSGGLIIPAGYVPPPVRPPLEQWPNQTNCAGLGSPCHSMDCCEPFYCGNFGLACKSP